jgi:tRNA uridine 5-carbamoylmethylation protein Kti12
MKLIAISGKSRHGKDTLANLIIKKCREQNIKIKKISFAEPIKKAALQMFPQLDRRDLFGASERREKIVEGYINPETGNPLKIRDILVQVGAWGRSCNPNCWANSTIFKAKHLMDLGYHVIISDERFKNEKKLVESINGKSIRIIRSSIGFTTNDISEIDLDDETNFAEFVYNTNRESLYKAASDIISKYII